MAGSLYVVTTPLGNLGDLTPRAAETFEQVDFIAAEDTRVTIKLLNHLGIKKQMVSYHEHSSHERKTLILKRIEDGESCALCSDAGVPAISDPGEELVIQAHRMGIRVVPIPGGCAAIAALCVSGQNTSRFVFEGFLSQNKKNRAERLLALKQEQRTMLIYEAPHKLVRTLNDLLETFGPERSLTLCRELTKAHEEIIVTTIQEAQDLYGEKTPRGEFVLVLAGADPQINDEDTLSIEQAAQLARDWMETDGIGASQAAKKAAQLSGYAKNLIYKLIQ